MINEIDKKILVLIQENGRLSNAAIAEEVGLTTSTVFDRIKKLEKRGVIERYVAIVDPKSVGKSITAFVRIVLGSEREGTYQGAKQELAEMCLNNSEIQECHSVAGEDCYILKVRVANTQELEGLIERLRGHALITKSTTNIVLSTIKEDTKVVP